jgi:hypothetical protein
VKAQTTPVPRRSGTTRASEEVEVMRMLGEIRERDPAEFVRLRQLLADLAAKGRSTRK